MLSWQKSMVIFLLIATIFFRSLRKWLYSDHDIFLESWYLTAVMLITKLKKLEVMGEYQMPEGYKAHW